MLVVLDGVWRAEEAGGGGELMVRRPAGAPVGLPANIDSMVRVEGCRLHLCCLSRLAFRMTSTPNNVTG